MFIFHNSTGLEPNLSTEVSIEELRLIHYLRSVTFGQCEILIQGGKPVLIKKISEHIKLD
jgi:hypothetical protein